MEKIQCIKIKSYPRSRQLELGSNRTGNGSETLIFCYGNSTGTKQGLVKVRYIVQLLWTLFSSSRT